MTDTRPVILDVGGGTGEWSRPYRLAGYDVRVIDPIAWPFWDANGAASAKRWEQGEVRGVLLAPPCTEFAGSGARWWAEKDPQLLYAAKQTVRDFLGVVERAQPKWWALENPVGRIARCVPELGKHRYSWQPWQFGDPETKRTCMWGEHVQPVPSVTCKPAYVEARVHRLPPSPRRAFLRSITPPGFAQAFFEANP